MWLRHVRAAAFGLAVIAALLAVAPNQTTSAGSSRRALDGASSLRSADIDVSAQAAFAITLSLIEASAPPAQHAALAPVETPPAVTPQINPFALDTELAPRGALWTKWDTVRAEIDAAQPALDRCTRDFRRCTTAARRFSAIIRKVSRAGGEARLAVVNREVNAAITFTSDMDQWKRDDVWSPPLNASKTGLFDTGKGDCEDYAIAKYVALRAAGVAGADLQLLMVKDNAAGIHHAVLAARSDDRWLILDNRRSRLLGESDVSFFTPLFALSEDGVKRFTTRDERVARLKGRGPV